MTARLRTTLTWVGLTLVNVGLALAVALRAHMGVDYAVDAEPSILALGDGDLDGFLQQSPAMGPLSLILRAPVVALASAHGLDQLTQYRLGSAACLVPVALIAFGIGAWLRRLGRPWYVVAAVVALLTVNPLIFNALQAGHPEEPLAAALCVAAVLLARVRPALAVVALVLALLTKQWAIVAIGPVLFAMPRPTRLRAAAALGVGAVLAGAWVATSHTAVWTTNVHLFRGSDVALPYSVWWYGAIGDGPARWVADWVGPVSRIVTVALPLAASALLARRGRSLDLQAALGLLTVAMFLRCLLDPADNPYYNVPAVFALLAWESARRSAVPWLGVATTGLLWALVVYPWRTGHPDIVAAVYVTWAVGVIAVLVAAYARRSSAVRIVSGIGTGLRVSRSTNTCTNQPSAAGSSGPASANRAIS